jgi:superfamily II DNA or RNA helicase
MSGIRVTPNRLVAFPAQYAASASIATAGFVRQLAHPATIESCSIRDFFSPRGIRRGELISRPNGRTTLVVGKRADIPALLPDGVDEVLIAKDGVAPAPNIAGRSIWAVPLSITNATATEWTTRAATARASWEGQIELTEEQRTGDTVTRPGLRPPQIGAVYAVLAHRTTTDEPATVVMPTGTGKTETMLALVAKERPACVLVVVPSDALRQQIAEKFETWGVLRAAGVIPPNAKFPVVGVLEHIPSTPAAVYEFFNRCNVVVTTIQTAGRATPEVQVAMADAATHLFVDEAHHIAAPTWTTLRRAFVDRPVVQFTATPFRRDRKHVDGRVIYNYPLRRAQAEGYFKSITFHPITEYDIHDGDVAIMETAVTQLDDDIAAGFDHIIMARADTINRANDLCRLYAEYAPHYSPVAIYSQLSTTARSTKFAALQNRSSRIVVCVDMLGEGFDLPSLKIAALHDVHKSLAVTIQFVGRFTRTTSTVGDATVIANVANAGVETALRELYAEDADWNRLLQRISTGATGRQAAQSEFLRAFGDVPAEVPLQNLIPKMSTVVFRTTGTSWHPEIIEEAIGAGRLYGQPAVNHTARVAVFVTREQSEVDWGDIRDLINVTWELFVVHWDESRNLLFVHSSDKGGTHEELAEAVAGGKVKLVDGEIVFRCMAGLTRLTIQNVGLNDAISHNRRFTMHSGIDVGEGLSPAHLASKIKTNAFGRGYENGSRASIGASRKGRLWSHWRAANLTEWLDWCHAVGDKLLDDTISTEQVFAGTLLSKLVTERPSRVPIAVDWGDQVWRRSDQGLEIEIAGVRVPLIECDLELLDHNTDGPLRFRVETEHEDGAPVAVEFEIVFRDGKVEYRRLGLTDGEVIVGRGRRERLAAWFQFDPPAIRFADTSYLEYNRFYDIRRDPPPPYPRDRIAVWNWDGVDITCESQAKASSTKNPKSIQFHVIKCVTASGYDPDYTIVFDDDASGEIADIVALAVRGDELLIHLYHCKFSGSETPSDRIKDLYEVCGQAQRSVTWKSSVERLLDRLPKRDDRRKKRYGLPRFEKGTTKALSAMRAQLIQLRPVLHVFIVQPGLSQAKASDEQLKLLAATELYLKETLDVALTVIASA